MQSPITTTTNLTTAFPTAGKTTITLQSGPMVAQNIHAIAIPTLTAKQLAGQHFVRNYPIYETDSRKVAYYGNTLLANPQRVGYTNNGVALVPASNLAVRNVTRTNPGLVGVPAVNTLNALTTPALTTEVTTFTTPAMTTGVTTLNNLGTGTTTMLIGKEINKNFSGEQNYFLSMLI